MSTTRQVIGLVLWMAVCFAAAGIGSRLTAPAIADWYARLNKPAWTPPNSVFGPVWTVLYLMMAVSAWLVWRRSGWAGAGGALVLFVAQLAINAVWTALFFGLKLPGAAFADIVILWCLIVITAVTFWRLTAAAGALLVPYLAWVSFAAVLNFAVWRLNR